VRVPVPLATLIAMIACLLVLPAAAAERVVPRSQAEVQASFAPLVRQVAPAVVNVYTRKVVRASRSPLFDDPFFRRFFGDDSTPGQNQGPGQNQAPQRVQNSLGSGVVVDPAGLIVTNNHVIKDSDEITVALADRREFNAEIVLADSRTDLAVLRIDTRGEQLPSLDFGDSDAAEVGDLVLAIGNPFNVGQTVTSGIISALARTRLGISDFGFFIQTDAAINRGNSGGALVTMDGRLIGVNTAIFSQSGGSIGIGFAIPSNMVRTVLVAARGGGQLVRPWLGIRSQPVTSEVAQSLGLTRPSGVLVNAVHAKSPAAKAGIVPGDLILQVDGHEVLDPQGVNFRTATRGLGGTSEFVVRRAGRERTVTVPLIAPPEDPPRETTELSGQHPFAGATVANLSPALAEELGVDSNRQGVILLKIANGSVAQRIRLRPGDIVDSVNGTPIARIDALNKALRQKPSEWRLAIRRGDQVYNLQLRG
jgi:Do/DeqQ family serine protease